MNFSVKVAAKNENLFQRPPLFMWTAELTEDQRTKRIVNNMQTSTYWPMFSLNFVETIRGRKKNSCDF